MDAPLYPPAVASYRAPIDAEPLTIYNVSLGELKTAPKAWALMLEYLPAAKGPVEAQWLQPHLHNFQVTHVARMSGSSDPAVLAKLDAAFRALPPSDKPQR